MNSEESDSSKIVTESLNTDELRCLSRDSNQIHNLEEIKNSEIIESIPENDRKRVTTINSEVNLPGLCSKDIVEQRWKKRETHFIK
jgi:hypothetical protein